jgi:hypothetical protein
MFLLSTLKKMHGGAGKSPTDHAIANPDEDALYLG